jgi:two-component system chemotaxis sensor kinase CheA
MSTDPSSSGNENSAFAEFLDDYFIECDEHLSVARRCVLALEPLLQKSTTDQAVLDELFRSFHSLKGLSAMVGFREAEQLAHHLERVLKITFGDERVVET